MEGIHGVGGRDLDEFLDSAGYASTGPDDGIVFGEPEFVLGMVAVVGRIRQHSDLVDCAEMPYPPVSARPSRSVICIDRRLVR